MDKRTVAYDGNQYKVKSNKIDIPDLASLDRMSALYWLNQNTYKRGYSTKRLSPLTGFGGAISVGVK